MNDTTRTRDERILRFGETVRYHRERMQMTLRDVAACIDISIAHLSEIERGQTTPGLDIVFSLAQLFRFSLDDLLGIDRLGFEIEAQDYQKGLALLRQARHDVAEGLALMSYLGLRAGLRHAAEEAPL